MDRRPPCPSPRPRIEQAINAVHVGSVIRCVEGVARPRCAQYATSGVEARETAQDQQAWQALSYGNHPSEVPMPCVCTPFDSTCAVCLTFESRTSEAGSRTVRRTRTARQRSLRAAQARCWCTGCCRAHAPIMMAPAAGASSEATGLRPWLQVRMRVGTAARRPLHLSRRYARARMHNALTCIAPKCHAMAAQMLYSALHTRHGWEDKQPWRSELVMWSTSVYMRSSM
jgi:hypothetical protein